MTRIRLAEIAHARSGDKGDASNVGLLANDERAYQLIREQVTAARVAAHFREICRGGLPAPLASQRVQRLGHLGHQAAHQVRLRVDGKLARLE